MWEEGPRREKVSSWTHRGLGARPVALGPDLTVLGAGLVALGASLNPDQQLQD